nr:serine protease inhibitor [Pseudarthrobacter sp. C4D7]
MAISIRDHPDAPEHVFRLVSGAGQPDAGTTLPQPAAALAVVERFGEDVFFPKPGPPKLCTQQYGGPQVAVVTGTFHGREVHSVFSRTDGCEIARWNAMGPLLGGTAT